VVSVSVNKPVNLSRPLLFFLPNNGTQALKQYIFLKGLSHEIDFENVDEK
jgi:hypothetical protein